MREVSQFILTGPWLMVLEVVRSEVHVPRSTFRRLCVRAFVRSCDRSELSEKKVQQDVWRVVFRGINL